MIQKFITWFWGPLDDSSFNSFHDKGYYDLPATVDYVLNNTGICNKISYFTSQNVKNLIFNVQYTFSVANTTRLTNFKLQCSNYIL